MSDRPELSEQDLHAYIDGELDAARITEITGMVNGDRLLASRVSAYRADMENLRNLFGDVAAAPLPAGWISKIERRAESKPSIAFPPRVQTGIGRQPRRYLYALAACLVLAAGIFSYYGGGGLPQEEAIVLEASAARLDEVQPRQSMASDSIATQESRAAFISAALMMPLKAPDLGKFGFELAQLRVYSGVPGGNAVQLEYRDGAGRRFTLYMRKSSDEARVDMIERNGIWTCIWQDDVLGTVMQGEIGAGEMARLASAAYNGLYF
jgi:anti-sigma factor RsiW